MKSKLTHLFSFGMSAALLIGSTFAATQSNVAASSHREAPMISQDPYADNTDVWAFVSPDRPDTVTIIGSWIPGELPQGGPNYYTFANDVIYKLNVDNDGDAKPDLTYEFKFDTTINNPNTFLYNVGPIRKFDDANLNQRTKYQFRELTDGVQTYIQGGLPVAPVNIGTKSNPNYENVWGKTIINNINLPEGEMKVFAGPTDDAFWVDLGAIFDLLTLRGQQPPVGYSRGRKQPTDGLKRFNNHSIAIQVPIDRLLKNAPSGETVIGVWATSERYSTRVLGGLGAVTNSGDAVQVSRLGMPLVNEVVLPLALKDAFNGLKPEQDFGLFTSGTPAGELLKKSVLDPELQNLLNALYGVPKPNGARTDLLAIFLTGMKTTKPFTIQTANGPVTLPAGTNVNQPANVQPAEMIRLNTAPPFRPNTPGSLCKPTPDYHLGLLGGDACGFPNGRRLQDDVIDIELLAVAGAAYPVLTNDTFNFNPDLIKVLDDNLYRNDREFRNHFPYLATPNQGQAWFAGGEDTQSQPKDDDDLKKMRRGEE
jgi:hypothetical protein